MTNVMNNVTKSCSVIIEPCTPKLRECYVSLKQCSVTPDKDHNGVSTALTVLKSSISSSVEPCTPNVEPALATELRRAITEKNILTTKTKSKFISALNELEVANAETNRRQRKEKAIREVVDSEIAYLKQLEVIIKYFKQPLTAKYILSKEEIEKIFNKVEMLYDLNKELLVRMNENPFDIANAFKEIAPFFKMYSTYAYEYKMISGFLQGLEDKNEEFYRFLRTQETRPEVRAKLPSLLITPIQRIPRYCLLLKQILLYTLESEPDYPLLKESLQIVEESAKHIDSLVEERENSERLLHIQNSLMNCSPQIIKPGRKLIKEGKVLKMTGMVGSVMYLVAMTDILMFCKIKKDNITSKNALKSAAILPLKKCRFTQNATMRKIHISCENDEIEIYIETVKDFNQWIDALKESHKNIIYNRCTLRKESSARYPVFKKDINCYNEVGISPGVPHRKRKTPKATTENLLKVDTEHVEKRKKPPYVTISKRRCIREGSLTNCKTNINDSLFPLRHHYLTKLDDNMKNEVRTDNSNSDNTNDVFVFGKPDNSDRGFNFRIANFFTNLGCSLRRFFGLK
ncbi:faciogenital dysplasia protein [Holotrichia oblita]|uniref:Faciogenital dysplasia protein n=1 Tax=Holotrichia oblita TaxID=644536 RepID=A0ACB9TWK1_HOLOL|nr:faciogenital dysplasia protein [Holotrichia oblita]